MNAPQIVSALLGEGVTTPQELVKGLPDLFAYYTYSPGRSIGRYEVKRWEGGSYHYIGEVWHDEPDNLWMAVQVAPGLNRHLSYIPNSTQAPARQSRNEAANDLWRLYRGERTESEITPGEFIHSYGQHRLRGGYMFVEGPERGIRNEVPNTLLVYSPDIKSPGTRLYLGRIEPVGKWWRVHSVAKYWGDRPTTARISKNKRGYRSRLDAAVALEDEYLRLNA